MSSVILKFDTKRIVHVDEGLARNIGLISVLEAYMSKVSKKAFNSIKSGSLNEITLSELGIVYNNWIYKNEGRHGVCWEYYIYNAIKHGDEFIQDMINESINILIEDRGYDDIDVILWGGEKSNINTANIKSIIDRDDVIWTKGGSLNFHDYIDVIHKAFKQKKVRESLPNFANEIWKTDLFVKKRNTNVWFAVSVKWNRNEIKNYFGIYIGIVFNMCYEQKNNINPEINNFNSSQPLIVINIYHGIAQYFLDVMRFVNAVLVNINVDSNKSNPINFPTVHERDLYEFLKNNREYRCYDVISYLKDKLVIKHKIIVADEIIAQTGKRIYITSTDSQLMNDLKILPKY